MHRRALFLSVLAVATAGRAQAQCLDWKPGFEPQGFSQTGTQYALAVFDSGAGPVVCVGGTFNSAGGAYVHHLAGWNGSAWSGVPAGSAGTDGTVITLAVLDDGSGAALYASGFFGSVSGVLADHVARWNGTNWAPLGSGLNQNALAFAVFDDGTGPAIYAGGNFTVAGGGAANRIAVWDGSTWSAVGAPGLDGPVEALTVFDDGSGPALFAAGTFGNAGGLAANRVARWDGSSWSALGAGLGARVTELAVYDDGSGPGLYAGGEFSGNVARWNGTTWSIVGSGPGTPVDAMLVHDDGAGSALYVGGIGISRWNGTSWSAPGGGIPGGVNALARYDSVSGPRLVATGGFVTAGGVPAAGFAIWDGAAWAPEHGAHVSVNDDVHAITGFDDGSGRALYVGGQFTVAGDAPAHHVARWDGSAWSSLASGTDGDVHALAVFDDGSGPALFAGGEFANAGGVAASNVARWNGTSWTPLAGGVDGTVRAMLAFDDGSGPALYVGGHFVLASGVLVQRIARWDGVHWTDLDEGFYYPSTVAGIHALAVFDDGTGAALYVGGIITGSSGGSTSCIARWNGSSWTPLAGGLNNDVQALTVLDVGAGPALYAGGLFTASPGGPTLLHVARWDGASWSAVGSGVDWSLDALAAFDDGSGYALYVGGNPFGAPSLAKWDGTAWSDWGAGTSGEVRTLAAYDLEATGVPDLLAGGDFRYAGNTLSWHIAEWQGCGTTGTRFCAGDGSAAACPCSNSGEPGHGCQNSPGTGGAVLEASGSPSVGADGVHFTASDVRANVLCLLMQGDAQVGPLLYGDGLRCAGGHLVRLFARAAIGNVFEAPSGSDPSISARSLALGDPLSGGATRVYQLFYRDPKPTFCPTPPGGTFNVSSAVRIDWTP